MSRKHPFIIPDWPAPANVKALSTTRLGGDSQPPFAEFNLGTHVGDEPAVVAKNRAQLLIDGQLPAEPFWLTQVHGTDVLELTHSSNAFSSSAFSSSSVNPPLTLPVDKVINVDGVINTDGGINSISPELLTTEGLTAEADASWCKHPKAVCLVQTADCLPVLLCDDAGLVVAAIHAGWRGLVGGILEKTVKEICAHAHVDATCLMAWLGPAIGPTAFQVGAEVRAAFMQADASAADAFVEDVSFADSDEASKGDSNEASTKNRSAETIQNQCRYLADIFLLAKQRLNAAGVSQVYGGGVCTFSDPEQFFSYRRDGVTGRMATLIWLD